MPQYHKQAMDNGSSGRNIRAARLFFEKDRQL